MNKRKLFVAICLLFAVVANAQLQWPGIKNTMKPWTRWWWEGSAVNKTDLQWNLQQYQKAGLGGVELTPIYGVYGYEKQFVNFLSPQWMNLFDYTLAEAKRRGIGVDLANGTGWPFGGPWVTDKDASKTIYYKTWTIKGGESLKEAVIYEQQALVRTANNKPVSTDILVQPVAANKNLQELALDQVQFAGRLPLVALIAYSETEAAFDLSDAVDATGKLNWTAPAGEWTLYGLFEGLHGKMVERAAPGGEGYAIDHFSLAAANNYFKKFDASFKGHDINYLRSFFNDSYEVDDAKGQANWTPDFFSEFKKRRGYDLKQNLPALFGKDEPGKNSRVIYDYRSVIDELLLEHFTMTWKKWASGKKKMVRNQSHGSPANTLDLYSVVDIPETEGNDILRFKFATSAANVSGKPLVSSESATWLDEHFLSSWGDVKTAIDLFFLGGVNHIFYHGTAYSPKDAPWPGWLFYAAVHFQPSNPQWKDFHALNEYITRVQSFLQTSKPDNDVLLYYPIIDRYAEPGNALLQHFDGMERNFEKTGFEHVSKWMLENSYAFDFFSDRQLQKFTISGDRILTGGNAYQAILLPANKLIDVNSFEKIMNLARQGARILVYKNLPKDVPGLGQLANRQKQFLQLLEQLRFTGDGKVKQAAVGKGTFYLSDDMPALMESAGIRKEIISDKGLQFTRRKNKDGQLYFINNRSDNAISDWVSLATNAVSIAVFDPVTGNKGLARTRRTSTGTLEVYLQLQPHESVLVQTYARKINGNQFTYKEENGAALELNGPWSLEFITGGPVLPAKMKDIPLKSWTELEGEEVKNFSGTARYTVSFTKPSGAAANYLLDLGKVNETVEIILNGKKIATLIGPSFQVAIPASAFRENNQLEVIVSNLMANRIAYMDRSNLPWKIFYNINMPARKRENVKNGLFDASSWKPLPSGLSGPVIITPLK